MKGIIISSVIAVALIGGVLLLSGAKGTTQAANANNVTMENGTQVVEIAVSRGYSPQVSVAKAGIPTIIRFKTQNAFDCSSAVSIPSLGYRANLPQTGTTDEPVTAAQATGTLSGTCAMGMYRFEVRFE